MKIKIRGAIVSNDDKWIYDWFDMEAVTPKDVEDQIKEANGEDIEVEISSYGGDVYAGSDIYTILKAYTGNVTVKVISIAASAASIVAMSGKKILISPTAQIMIHNVRGGIRGDYRAMEHGAEILKGWNKSIANAYILKTGMKLEELLDLMSSETWLTAQDALKYNFVDEIMFDDEMRLVAGVSGGIIPPEVVSKMKNLLKKELNPLNNSQPSEPPVSSEPISEPKSEEPPPPEPPQDEGPRQAPVDLYQKLNLINRRKANV